MTKGASKTLIAVTTFNHCDMTRLCLETLQGISQDVKVFDDCSTDDTRALCEEFNIPFFSNAKPQGLTSLWNQAFREFVNSDYQYLVITNNDVLFPRNAIDQLERDLEVYSYVGVLTRHDDSRYAVHQAVELITGLSKEFVNQPSRVQEVQDRLKTLDLCPKPIQWVYGFCFGISRKIIPEAFSPFELVDPNLINTGQEDDLKRRISSKMLSRRVFVYHYKGVSCGPIPPIGSFETRDDLGHYHKNEVSLRLRVRYMLKACNWFVNFLYWKMRHFLKLALSSLR